MGSAVAPRFSLDAWLEPLTNPTVRRFLTVRLALALAAIADPFYVVYGLRELDLELTAIGYFLAALVGARLLAGPLWSFGLRRRGSRTVLQLAGLCRLLVPLVALLLPYLAETELYRERVTDARVTSALFGLVFAVYGLALAGLSAGSFAFLLDAVSPPERSHTFALTNLLLGAVALVPFAGALLVEAYSFETVFLAATLATLTGIFLTGALPDTNVRVRTGAAAWRLRRARP
jgi:MFS family permease